MLKTKPTVFARVSHEARDVRDSVLAGAGFMLANRSQASSRERGNIVVIDPNGDSNPFSIPC
jgi:hypothetical protein